MRWSYMCQNRFHSCQAHRGAMIEVHLHPVINRQTVNTMVPGSV